MVIIFEIPMAAVPKARPRVTRAGITYTAAKTKRWENSVAIIARSAYGGVPLDGPLHLALDFVLPRPQRLRRKKDDPGLIPADRKPDLDNLIKSVMDGISRAGLWVDDARVVSLSAAKYYAEKDGLPRVSVSISGDDPCEE